MAKRRRPRLHGLAPIAIALGLGLLPLAADRPAVPAPRESTETTAIAVEAARPTGSGRARNLPTAAAAPRRRAKLPRPELRQRIADEARAAGFGAGAAAPRVVGSLRRDRTSARALALREHAGALVRAPSRIGAADIEHTRFHLHKDGRPVWNRPGILRERSGRVLGRAGWSSLPPIAEGAPTVGAERAITLARAEIDAVGTAEHADLAQPKIEVGYFALAGRTVPAWRVTVYRHGPEAWQIVLDARTGEPLSVVDRALAATGTGSVFDPNVALSPTPSTVPLERLDGSGQLQGDVVRVFDLRAPAAFRPGLDFLFPVSDPRFVQTAVYRGVTDTGLLAEAHGFPPFSEPLIAYTNLPGGGVGGELNNAFYLPGLALLFFGNGDGVVTSNLGTDLDVAAHETGHHVFSTLVAPEVFALSDPILAMDEGVADTWAVLAGGDPDVGESTIPGQPFLRSVDNAASFPSGVDDDPHVTGLVYGGANWDLQQLLGANTFADLLVEALLRLPSEAVESDYRDAFLAANLETRGGAEQTAIAQIFADRGFDAFEVPPDVAAFLDALAVLEDGIPESAFLPAFDSDFYLLQLFPGTRAFVVNTSGGGDVDLFTFPLTSIDDPLVFIGSQLIGTSDETVVVNAVSDPPIGVDDLWFVQVDAFENSSYTVRFDAALALPDLLVDGLPAEGEIAQGGALDFLSFPSSGTDQIVRVEVEALDETIDPLVGVFDARSFDLLASDDDSGPGRDALLQGVRLPRADTWGIAVLSVTADVDPSVGAGRYRVTVTTCGNVSGPDSDGDGLRDACDDDDDDDGTRDADDSAPLDPDLCFDLDLDGCDDCVTGSDGDPFDDGLDTDFDGLCDAGDSDDDNDGCLDSEDASVLVPSTDDDFDFLGDDCDVCSALPDPAQIDRDADGFGDVCDCDFDGDGLCNVNDFALFLGDFVSGIETILGTDMDGSAVIDVNDFSLFLPGFQRGVPGPSGATR